MWEGFYKEWNGLKKGVRTYSVLSDLSENKLTNYNIIIISRFHEFPVFLHFYTFNQN